VLQGDIPYQDFPSGYAPGIYYLLALLGEDALRSPITFKLVACLAQTLNSLLVFSVLRRLGTAPPLALLFTAGFGGLTTAAWGMALQLEAFVNLFALLAFWLLLRDPHPVRGAAAGLSMGCALLVKQYALFALPPVLLACLLPVTTSRPNTRPTLSGGRGAQLATLLVAAPIPYAVFLLGTGLDPVENFLHLATFGSGASGYGAWGFASMWEMLVAGNVGRFLLPTLLFGAWLLLRVRSWRVAVLVTGFVLGMLPLYVRSFDYYVQSALPWSIFVMAEFARVSGARFRETAAATTLVSVLIVLPLLSIIWTPSRVALHPATSISEQIELARQLEEEVEGTEGVLVLNGSWLYTLTRFVPPQKDYAFNVDPEVDDERRSQTRFAIILGGSGPVNQVRAWLQEDGMSLRRRIRWEGRTIYVMDREVR
jgi:hypothetical protein